MTINFNGHKNSMKNSKSLNDLENKLLKENSEIQQLLRQIHQRFEQKFKDYRIAFRNFDFNFDG